MRIIWEVLYLLAGVIAGALLVMQGYSPRTVMNGAGVLVTVLMVVMWIIVFRKKISNRESKKVD